MHEAVDKLCRNWFAGLIVAGKGIQEFFLVEIVLVELRGQLHEIAVYVGARY